MSESKSVFACVASCGERLTTLDEDQRCSALRMLDGADQQVVACVSTCVADLGLLSNEDRERALRMLRAYDGAGRAPKGRPRLRAEVSNPDQPNESEGGTSSRAEFMVSYRQTILSELGKGKKTRQDLAKACATGTGDPNYETFAAALNFLVQKKRIRKADNTYGGPYRLA